MYRQVRRGFRKPVRVNKMNPESVAVCDGCGFTVQYTELRWQKDYRGGDAPTQLGQRVCNACYDTPNQQLRLQVFKPDPIPNQWPRPQPAVGFNLLAAPQVGFVNEEGQYIMWS